MKSKQSFFARKEQSEFIQRVYREAPISIQRLFQQENELLRQAVAGCASALEIGCGFGRAAEYVPPEIRYVGIDIAFSYVAEAHFRFPGKAWCCGDAMRLPFQDSSFDAVFLIQNTIGNMEGIEEKVLAEAKRVLKRGARLIVSAYSEDSFDIRRVWYDRLVDVGIFGHVWLETPGMARSDTGWSSRCFNRDEMKQFYRANTSSLEITKLDSFLYFCVGIVG
jgi:ubiquinone/menaquinone biosynthesis C-methylase UbiE